MVIIVFMLISTEVHDKCLSPWSYGNELFAFKICSRPDVL